MRILWAFAACSITASVARAQCPDGSSPPCRSPTVASRRADPSLDSRSWIILPFENIARVGELDWLRDASVNLLYLDMSRWTDIRVVDDERVSDLLRDLAIGRSQPISLSDGLAVARSAGARQLIMGDVLKAGARIAVVAKVFDVRNGQRLRSVREEVTSPDSLFSVFSRLARSVLDVAPPEGANLGALGTKSVAGYQEYLAGVSALNAFDLPTANRRLTRALELDSTFALAHYKLALSLLWGSGRDPRGREHVDQAVRLSTQLPRRERTLIKAFSHFPRGEFLAMCETLAPLVRADSSDVEALAGMADCLFHDNVTLPAGADTTVFRFRGSWNESVRLYRRVLELDPSYHLAYQHIVDTYTAETRAGPPIGSELRPATARPLLYTAIIGRSGDTLVMRPMRPGTAWTTQGGFEAALYDRARLRARRQNLEEARRVVDQWLVAAPSEARAHAAAARVFTIRGQLARALTHLDRSRAHLAMGDSSTFTAQQLDLHLRLFEFDNARRLVDSMARTADTDGERQFPIAANALMGKLKGFDSTYTALQGQRLGAVALPYYLQVKRLLVGLASDSAVALEPKLPPPPEPVALRARRTLWFAFRAPRSGWPALDSLAQTDVRWLPAAAAARNDTTSMRRAARAMDSLARESVNGLASDRGAAWIAAEAFLALRDTANALRVARWGLDTALTTSSMLASFEIAFFSYPMAPLMLLRADLAAARGMRDEARLWYARLLDLYAGADPELAPLLERVRRGHAAAGG